MKSKKIYSIVPIGTMVLALGIFLSLVYMYIENKKIQKVVFTDTIYHNVFIEDVNVGGLNKNEAIELLKQRFLNPTLEKQVTFVLSDKKWLVSFQQFECQFNIEQIVNEAYEYARTGKIRYRYNQIMDLQDNPKYLKLTYTYNNDLVNDFIALLEKEINLEMINSQMQRINGYFTGTQEQIGKKLNSQKALDELKMLLDSQTEGTIDLEVQLIYPWYTKDYYEKMNNVIGSYTTVMSGGTESRDNNISVAVKKINGQLIYPEEVFSFSKTISPMTPENGYTQAPVIIQGKLEDGVGGGVCQVSTTLYNAIMYSELEIVQRQCHSRPVGYVPLGMDAAIAGDYLDLKFKNISKYPIYIESYVKGNKVTVVIYGYEGRNNSRIISFESVISEIVKPSQPIKIEDNSLFVGEELIVTQPKDGYKVLIYKKIYQGNSLIDKVLISTNTYKPVRAEIRIGTKNR